MASTSRSSEESADSKNETIKSSRKNEDNESSLCPFKLLWAFGINSNVPLINLTTKNRTVIAYACCHVVLIYNYESKEAVTLQGHQNAVMTLSITKDGKWLLSADFEKDSAVVVWDTERGLPICTLFNPHQDKGLTAARISPNAKYLVTVGNERYQRVYFWLWTYGKDEPNAHVELTRINSDRVKEIAFNEDRSEEFALTADYNVIFFLWEHDELKYNNPKASYKKCGMFNTTCFVSKMNQSLTATANGYIVVWNRIGKSNSKIKNEEWKHIKTIKLQTASITVVLNHNGMIVTGSSEGRINFYDIQLKILYWCENCGLDCIRSISFDLQSMLLAPPIVVSESKVEFSEEDDLEYEGEFEESAESKEKDIVCDEWKEFLKRIELTQNTDDVFSTITVNIEHRFRNYDEGHKEFVKSPHVPTDATLANAPFHVANFFVGDLLACGLENGTLWMLHPITLEPLDTTPYKHSTGAINRVIFTECADYMAYSDNTLVVAVFKRNRDTSNFTYIWSFIGKYRSHCANIRDILFGPPISDNSIPRLFSLGEDKKLIEYDLKNSGYYPEPGLKINEIHQIEYSATPLCLSWYPQTSVEKFLVIFNSEYKYRLLNDTTKMIRGTFLGPIFGTPIQQFQLLGKGAKNSEYMIFATEREIGIQMLPLDGNPYKILGIIGHPYKITNMQVNCDSSLLFTCGNNDSCVLMWKIKCRSVDALAQLGGTGISPYYGLIKGGSKGWLFNEMKDLFYYVQILHQGENTTATRIVSDKVSTKQILNLMCAIGFYPSKEEIDILINEISYKIYAETGQLVEEITFEDFIKFYINHRPACGISLNQLQQAFQALANVDRSVSPNERNHVLTREQFLNVLFGKGPEEILTTNSKPFGEPLTEKEAYVFLKFLIDFYYNIEDIHQQDNSKQSIHMDFSFLPKRISYKDFAEDIMGIELPEEARADNE